MPPVQWVLGTVSPWVKWLANEVDQTSHLAPELRMSGATLPLSHTPLLRVKGNNFTVPVLNKKGEEQKYVRI
jgi:hypothetical protein